MILYKYTADCSKLNLEQEDSTKEGYERLYSRRSDAAEWNSKFYTAYRTEKKFFIMISDILNGQMTIVAALEMEVVPRVCVDCIQKILPGSCLRMRRSQMMRFAKNWFGQNGITGRSVTAGR